MKLLRLKYLNLLLLLVSQCANAAGVWWTQAGSGTGSIAASTTATEVSLTANPGPGSSFTGWSGDCTGTGTCTLVNTATSKAIAHFATRISAGNKHNLALHADGGVWGWGYNISGQLGVGTTQGQWLPKAISGLGISLAAVGGNGGDHSLFLLADGSVRATGENLLGQIGDGTTADRSAAVNVSGLTNVVAIAAGASHSLALRNDGTVWAWGRNSEGQSGSCITTACRIPSKLDGLTDIVDIAAGGYFSLALKANGEVWSWGGNSEGQLGYSGPTQSNTAALIPGLTDVVAIRAGREFAMALRADGTVWAWGSNRFNGLGAVLGQLGVTSVNFRHAPEAIAGLSDVEDIQAGWAQALARKKDGSLWGWGWGNTAYYPMGNNVYGAQPKPFNGFSNVIAMAEGSLHTVAVLADGSLLTVGANDQLQRGDSGNIDTALHRQTATRVGSDASGYLNLFNTSASSLRAGWNLTGNSNTTPMDVASHLGDATKVNTVWKWVPTTSKWAFYAPSMAANELATYAASKGYEVLSTINGGEGFWVNAQQAFTIPPAGAMLVNSTSFQQGKPGALKPGWNLVTIGNSVSPAGFNGDIGATPPPPGIVPVNLTSLWAWDSSTSKWYFYAPSLELQGGSRLSDFISGKGYLDFNLHNKTLGNGAGFWVNKP